MSYSGDYLHLPKGRKAKAKILVIEDNSDIQLLFYETLQAKGFQVLLASDGEIGLWMAQELMPDLVLSDIGLPKLDGYAVLQALRQDPSTAAIPLVFCTGQEDTPLLQRGLKLGASAYLVKPIDVSVLLRTINTLLAEKKSPRQEGLVVPPCTKGLKDGGVVVEG